jgi:hypothetical protein
MDVPTIITEVGKLPLDDQLTVLLAFRVRESKYIRSLMSEEDLRELDRRIDAYESSELPGTPWEEVREQLGWNISLQESARSMDVPTLIREIEALDAEDMLEVLESIRDNLSAARLSDAEIERINQRILDFEAKQRRPS